MSIASESTFLEDKRKMAGVRLYQEQKIALTAVPNVFIDTYMPQANGEFVKLYLYLLRSVGRTDADFSISAAADQLLCTERDVLRALQYWERQRLLYLERDESGELTGICFPAESAGAENGSKPDDLRAVGRAAGEERIVSDDPGAAGQTAATKRLASNGSTAAKKRAPAAPADTDTASSQTTAQGKAAEPPVSSEGAAASNTKKESVTNRFIQSTSPSPRTYSMKELTSFCEQKDIREMVFTLEDSLGRTINQNDLNTIFYWYDEFQLPAELIRFLVEHCVQKGHPSLRYMQRVAEDYFACGIRTVEEAKDRAQQDADAYHAVMKAFGIRGRSLTEEELAFLNSWSRGMGFSSEMIAEACTRTIRATHEPAFKYANSILEKWQRERLTTPEDVARSDEQFKRSRKSRPGQPASNAGSFSNFKQRENNYEELQKQLIQRSMKP